MAATERVPLQARLFDEIIEREQDEAEEVRPPTASSIPTTTTMITRHLLRTHPQDALAACSYNLT